MSSFWPREDKNLKNGQRFSDQRNGRSHQPFQEMKRVSPPHSRNSNSNFEGGLTRESFGKARSQPVKAKPKSRSSNTGLNLKPTGRKSLSLENRANNLPSDNHQRLLQLQQSGESLRLRTDSDRQLQVTLKRSRSATELDQTVGGGVVPDKSRFWTDNPKLGPRIENADEVFVTRHMLYKEQQAVIDHVKAELFPIVGVNTQVVKAEGLRSRVESKSPNPYCVVAIEPEGSYAKKDWQNFATDADTSFYKIAKIIRKGRGSVAVEAAARRIQFYENVPLPHKTAIRPYDRNPLWDQTFQCVSVHPSTDSLTVEVWDCVEDDTMVRSIEAFNSAHRMGKNPIQLQTTPQSQQQPLQRQQTPRKLTKEDVKQSDVFLGKVSKKVCEIPCEGYEKFLQLEGLTGNVGMMACGKLKLRVWLVHLYRHGQPYFEMVDKRTMLKCLWDWILSFEKKRNGIEWDGTLPPEANCLLYQYALQTGISEEVHCYIRWESYVNYKLDIEGLDGPLKDLDVVLKKRQSSIIRSTIDDSHLQIETSILTLMEDDIFPIIRNHLREKEDLVSKALKSYKNCVDVLSKLDISYALPIIQTLFERALRLCFLEWYQYIYPIKVHTTQDCDRCQKVKYYVELIEEVNKLLVLGTKKWGPLFWMLAQYEPYMPVMYEELQKMVNHDIEQICWKILKYYDSNKKLRHILQVSSKQEECIATAMFSLYAGTQTFVDAQSSIYPADSPFENLSRYYKWFRPILVLWLGFAVIRGSEMITRCVNIDSASLDNIHNKTSTSALDTAAVIHQLVHFWQKLMWPDVCEKYIIIHFLVEVMCYFTVLYATRKYEKLELEGFFDTTDRFDISERLCTALNNIEYVKEALEGIPEEIKYNELLQELEDYCGHTRETQAYRMRLKRTFTVAFVNVDIVFRNILSGLGHRVSPEVRGSVQQSLDILQQGMDNECIHESLDPILNYIDRNIVMLSRSLLVLNFARMLQFFWNIVLKEIVKDAMSRKIQAKDAQYLFFKRILSMLPLLKTYFQNGDGGLNDDELETPDYWETSHILSLFTIDTNGVIEHFYGTRGAQQMEIERHLKRYKPHFGTVSVRVGYWSGRLSVEVICANDLLPVGDTFHVWQLCKKKTPNNDPYIEIQLQPEHFFSNARMSKTKTHWRTTNPIYNEKFQWDVSHVESIHKNAVIVLTVKDYDYLSGNDFLGEAVIPFTVIPGITDKPIAQPMHVHLREVEPSPILNILKSRTWDSVARRFYERQAKRHFIH